jgi:hypothetical protein
MSTAQSLAIFHLWRRRAIIHAVTVTSPIFLSASVRISPTESRFDPSPPIPWFPLGEEALRQSNS